MTLDMRKLKRLSQAAANNAATSLTKLTGMNTKIDIYNIQVDQIQNQLKSFSLDSLVASIQLPIQGDIKGSTLLLFPNETAEQLTQILTDDKFHSFTLKEDLKLSSLKEIGNIVCGSFLTVIANKLEIHVVEYLPVITFDTLSTVLNNLHREEDEHDAALLIEIHFDFDEKEITGYIVLAFELNELAVLEKKLITLDI